MTFLKENTNPTTRQNTSHLSVEEGSVTWSPSDVLCLCRRQVILSSRGYVRSVVASVCTQSAQSRTGRTHTVNRRTRTYVNTRTRRYNINILINTGLRIHQHTNTRTNKFQRLFGPTPVNQTCCPASAQPHVDLNHHKQNSTWHRIVLLMDVVILTLYLELYGVNICSCVLFVSSCILSAYDVSRLTAQ